MEKIILGILLCGMCMQFCLELAQTVPICGENDVPIEEDTSMEHHVQRMKSLMNTSVDPCDNFYNYACGNYINTIEDLETPQKRTGLFDLGFVVYDQLDEILRKQRDPNDEYFEELEVARKFVDTCSEARQFPIEPSDEYLEELRTIGGFPAVDPTWDETSFDWFNMTAHLTRYGIVGFVDEKIVPSHPFYPFYSLPTIGFGFDVYLENIATNMSDGYIYNERIMRNLLQVYGVSGTKAYKVIDEVFVLWREIMILKSRLPEDNLIIIRQECSQLSKMDDIGPDFQKWKNLFDIAWGQRNQRIPVVSLCPCNWFYIKLDHLAKKKPEAFANYMALKFLFSMHLQLESTKFQRRQCIAIVKASMPLVFSHFYMKEHYNKENEDEISEIISELKDSWKYQIDSADWLGDAGHDEALQKLNTVRSRIGQIVDPISDIYIKQVRSLNLTDNADANMLRLAKFKVDMRHYGTLHSNENEKTAAYDILDAARVRAFYMILENNFNLMAGILQPPVYHRNFPNSLKYGRLGYVIGHEISHGFEGRGFHVNSKLSHRPWLPKKSLAIAERRSNCFVDDYKNFKVPDFEFEFNGKKALSEILADSLGLREAFGAYRRVMKYSVKHEGDSFAQKEHVPGLNLSNEQTFFVAFAQLFCAKYEPKVYWGEANANHPVDRYRVMGTLRNFEEFSNVFNCPQDSPMNPSRKCRLW